MNDDVDMGDGVPFEIGGEACKLRALTLADQVEYEGLLRQRAVALLSKVEAMTLVQKTEAAMCAMRFNWFSPECIASIETALGQTTLVWLATKETTGLSFDEFLSKTRENEITAGIKLVSSLTWPETKKNK